jgi:hypothetical protein
MTDDCITPDRKHPDLLIVDIKRDFILMGAIAKNTRQSTACTTHSVLSSSLSIQSMVILLFILLYYKALPCR